jgi:hypothetical protein
MSSEVGAKTREERERDAECARRQQAAVIAVVSLILGGILVALSMRVASLIEHLTFHALAAFALAAGIVMGARAVEGPVELRGNRRGDANSPAASAIRLWVTCFLVIEAVLFLTVLGSQFAEHARIPGGGVATKSREQ